MALFIPNSIENDTPADAAELQENYATIQTYTNSSLIHRDGSVAMTQPLTLVGDPTQNNHAANKQYVDAVEAHADLLDTTKVAKAGDTMTGALIAGQAKMFTRPDIPLEAIFCNVNAPEGSIGLIAHSSGTNGLVQGAGQYLHIWNKKAGVAGHDLRASFGPTGTSFYQTVEIDEDGGDALVLKSTATAMPFLSFWHGSSRYGYIQARGTTGQLAIATDPAWPIDFLVANSHKFRIAAGYTESYQRTVIVHSPSTGVWDTAGLEVRSSGYARIALHMPGVSSPQLRAGGYGSYMEVVNGSSSAYEGLVAQAYVTASAAATKRDVRPLRAHRKTVAKKQNVRADKVDAVDVTALRPVVYRHKEPLLKLCGEDDKDTMPWPTKETAGREHQRERLGLVADEVQHVIPSAVIHDADDKPLGIDYAQITVALLDHVQALTERVAELEAKLS